MVLESRRELFSIKLTTIAHRGGHILFGPDGYLWFGMGDGSLLEGGESVQRDPQGQAQTLDNWNGKMLRLDPNPSKGNPYSIPQDNPYADKKGTRPEIYLSGMRNPWRFSFDRRTDDLWIGDVGQYVLEEIDFLPKARPAGGNLGWNRLEGTLEFQGTPPPDALSPLHVYNHNDGRCVVVGGYTYRGRLIEGLHGAYLYGDFCDGRIRALVQKKGQVLYEREDLGLQVDGLIAFGEDSEGELYAVSLSKGVFSDRAPPALRTARGDGLSDGPLPSSELEQPKGRASRSDRLALSEVKGVVLAGQCGFYDLEPILVLAHTKQRNVVPVVPPPRGFRSTRRSISCRR